MQSFDDLHKLWFVLYKERNVLLTLRDRFRRTFSPIPDNDDSRYLKVKRSMAAIKYVLHERKQIQQIIKSEEDSKAIAAGTSENGTVNVSNTSTLSQEEPRLP